MGRQRRSKVSNSKTASDAVSDKLNHDPLGYAKTLHTHSHRERQLHLSEICRNLREQPEPHRDIERIQVENVSNAEFQERFVRFSIPVVIQGVAEDWPAMEKWSCSEKLIEHYGDMLVHILEVHGKPLRARLGDFLHYALESDADYPLYCFEDDFSGCRSRLLDDFSVPSYFSPSQDLFEVERLLFNKFRYLLIGAERTGSKMHIDPKFTCAWNTSLCGLKRWVLLPPGTSAEEAGAFPGARHSFQPPAYWWQDEYPRLSRDAARTGLIECLQMPGETIFVPQGWWHAVLNVSPLTVAITQNLLLPATLPTLLPYIIQRWPSFGQRCATYLKNPDAGLAHGSDTDRDDPGVCSDDSTSSNWRSRSNSKKNKKMDEK